MKNILCYDKHAIFTSLIDKRVLTLIGQYLPPISPDQDAGQALNQHWFICGQLRDDRRRQ